MARKSKLELSVERENLEEISKYIQRKRKLIYDMDRGSSSKSTGSWERIRNVGIEFKLEHYEFKLMFISRQLYDTRDDDGTAAGWTTQDEQEHLIIKNRNDKWDKLDIFGSKYISSIYDAYKDEKIFRRKLSNKIIQDISKYQIETIEIPKEIEKQVGCIKPTCYKMTNKKDEVIISQIQKFRGSLNFGYYESRYDIKIKKSGKIIRSYHEKDNCNLKEFFKCVQKIAEN